MCLSVPLISTGNSSDSFPSKNAFDIIEMQLENKQTKPSSKLFGGSKADKGNCKAEKEMFFPLSLTVSRPY